MDRIRRGYELQSLFFGRPVRPFHLAVTLSTLIIAISNLTSRLTHDEKTFLGHTSSMVLGAFALTAVVMLTIGWWYDQDFSAEWGLLIATGVWMSRAVYIALTNESTYVLGTTAAVVLSLAWAIGAGGAYILERYDHVMNMRENSE